jgi:hypothetical protein
MTTFAASVTIVGLPVGTTVTGAELGTMIRAAENRVKCQWWMSLWHIRNWRLREWVRNRRRRISRAALHPVLEHLQGCRAIAFGGAGHRAVVAFLDPAFLRAGIFVGQRQPHQATRPLARQIVAIDHHAGARTLRARGRRLLGPDKRKSAREISELRQGLPPDMVNACENAMQIL